MADALALDQSPPPNPLGKGTLGRRLVLQVTALVALVAILLSAATLLTTRTLLMDQLNDQLNSVTTRQRGDNGRRGPSQGLVQYGQPISTISVAVTTDLTVLDSGILTESGPADLPVGVAARFAQVPANQAKSTIQVPGLGRYRVTAYPATLISSPTQQGQPGVVIVGVAQNQVDHTLAQLLAMSALLSLLAIGAAALLARSLIERGLRPLNRVAATAQQVSQLPLDRGEVALAVRVPPADADPTSEVGRVGQALNHMLNNVEDALEARQASEMKVRQFVADASHELRNPLAAIRGYAELTRRSRSAMPDDAAYAMSRVESEAERMSRLVEDLLLLARLDSGPAIDVQPTDLTEIVINAVSDARAAGPDHVWQLSLPDEPVLAVGDRNRLHQVVANLLANARTHTPPGTRVETAIDIRDGQALIRVTDNGQGIPADIQSKVFERFTRADTSRVRAEGATSGTSTGLGLAIVAAVVEAHQGRVTVSSVPGRTEFSVWLPLAEVSAAAPERLSSGPHPFSR
ncbi:sensor histidine kinase [uncultured Friedmanniella sp.]|uniref:sensor histidine kinase n=1 Tax=uncultured Friedmanniella sp. TaxID=335381 RepID=UPI0035C954BF